MMIPRRLPWDTAFFSKTVDQIDVVGTPEPQALLEALGASRAAVTYVFIDADHASPYHPVLESVHGARVDIKVTYGKQVDPAFAGLDPELTRATDETPALLDLAYESGHLSRFHLDPRFDPHFRPLYREWIRKSLADEGGRVFTLASGPDLDGMVTASVENGLGKIGLIAIRAGLQGKGLGMRFLKHCEAYYHDQGARHCKVVTQQANAAACKLYERAGYAVETAQEIWHVWKD